MELRQNDQDFWEVYQGENVLYTCLKQEDAESYRERHQHDPPPIARKTIPQANFNSYIHQPGITYRCVAQPNGHWVDVNVTAHGTSEFWVFDPNHRVYHRQEE